MAKTKTNSKITIDKLAVMIQNGFIGVDKRFEKMERDISGLKDGLERVELRLTNVAYRFELQ